MAGMQFFFNPFFFELPIFTLPFSFNSQVTPCYFCAIYTPPLGKMSAKKWQWTQWPSNKLSGAFASARVGDRSQCTCADPNKTHSEGKHFSISVHLPGGRSPPHLTSTMNDWSMMRWDVRSKAGFTAILLLVVYASQKRPYCNSSRVHE